MIHVNITPTHQNVNELLGRTEVQAHITFETLTPKNAEVQQLVAQLFKSDEKNVVIKHIYSDFGAREADVIAHIYYDEAAKKVYEPKPKVKKAKAESDKPAEKKAK